jgi:hypothetical protein
VCPFFGCCCLCVTAKLYPSRGLDFFFFFFLQVTSDRELRVVDFSDVELDYGLPVRRVSLGRKVQSLEYHPEEQVIVACTARPKTAWRGEHDAFGRTDEEGKPAANPFYEKVKTCSQFGLAAVVHLCLSLTVLDTA